MGAPEGGRGRGARWSGTATRRESRARSTTIWMHFSSILELWFLLAMLRDSNKNNECTAIPIPIENYLAQGEHEIPVLTWTTTLCLPRTCF